ncbi:ABC transporter permease [Paenibacillus sp. YYML68]|uniref:ABC transporter permease n=1 Tax=Paenibacillus sp. YYML68 TaxID=2909250 RepID=UPI0024908B51|nr:ABC transporter permease subunit [Paenibacillus sp. YYML68]
MIRRSLLRSLLLTLGLLLVAVMMAMPFVTLLPSSLYAVLPWPQLIPEHVSARAWRYLLAPASNTGEAVLTSIIIAVCVTAINLVLAIPAADALARHTLRGKRAIEALLYAPIVLPAFVSVMGAHLTFIRFGLTESIIGVILAHLSPSLPYMIRALTISFSTLSFAWEEQAAMLGAGPLARLRYVVWPHIRQGVAAGAALSMLVSLSQYLITFLVGGGQVMTLPILLLPFASGGDSSIAAAYTIVFAVLAAATLGLMNVWLRRYDKLQ